MKTVLVVGATGRQGEAMIQHFSSTNEYKILALTRNTTSPGAQKLGALPHVELVASPAEHGYDLDAFHAAASRSDFVVLNIDGFALGEIAETYWGIRLFQIAQKAGVRHLLYSGLEYSYEASGYDGKYYVGHFEGKARVQQWMKAQPKGSMKWSIIRSGPYVEMLSTILAPRVEADGTHLFTIPLAEGAIPFVTLGDFGKYAHWVFSHTAEAADMDLGIGIDHVSGQQLAEAFTTATGKQAKYVNVPLEAWVDKAFEKLPNGRDTKIGFASTTDQSTLSLTFAENFSAWWRVYQASVNNTGLIVKDYAMLDKLVPGRVKSIDQWFRETGYTGVPAATQGTYGRSQ